MPNYTHLNLNDVENQAPNFGLDEGMEARFATGDLGLEKSGAGFIRLAPGFRVPFGHAHSEQEELYVVIRGNAKVKLDDETIELREYDAVRVGPGVTRNVEAGPEGVEYLAFGAPAVENKREEANIQPGWWQD
jgi:uncharacterized cupin superfamily protein